MSSTKNIHVPIANPVQIRVKGELAASKRSTMRKPSDAAEATPKRTAHQQTGKGAAILRETRLALLAHWRLGLGADVNWAATSPAKLKSKRKVSTQKYRYAGNANA